MLISLDYDATFTNDPDLWITFVKQAQERGHIVKCITMRFPEGKASMDPRLLELVEVIFTSHKGKRQFIRNLGMYVDVWVDDSPEYICNDA